MQRYRVVLLMILLVSALTGEAAAEQRWIGFDDTAAPGQAPQISVTSITDDELIVTTELPGVWLEDREAEGQLFQIITIPGEGCVHVVGRPEIPVIGRIIAIPGQTGVIVTAETEIAHTINGVNMWPAQRVKRSDGGAGLFQLDTVAYQSDKWLPAEIAAADQPSILRDVRVVRLQLAPVRYHPVRQEVVIHKTMTVRVSFTGQSLVNALAEPIQQPISPTFDHIYRSTILNYEWFARGWRTGAEEPMLIIVPDAMYQEVLAFSGWKTRKGYPVTIARTSETGTTAAAIKSYLQTAYDTWSPRPVFVILAGDSNTIPPNWGIGSCASDYMYTTLAGSDIDPDIIISRISAQTSADYQNQINKIVSYERFPAAAAAGEWHTKASGISSSDGSPTNDDTRLDRIRNAWLAHGLTLVDRLYQSTGQATVTQIQQKVNEGRTWLTYMGHGSGTSWTSTTPSFSTTHINQLNNGSLNPVVVDISCDNGAFARSGDCFAEVWMKTGTALQPRGAVGIYSSSTSTAWDESGELGEGVTYAFANNGARTWGAAALGGLLYLRQQMGSGSNVQEVFQQYVLFGDCSLTVFTAAPAPSAVTHEDTIAIGPGQYSVAVSAGGRPVGGALVCVKKFGEFYSVARTNLDGTVALEVEPLSEGTAELTVTGFNIVPYEATLTVTASGCGRITLDSTVVSCAGTLGVTLRDSDLNANPSAAELAEVLVQSDSDPAGRVIQLVETGPDTDQFTGTAAMSAIPGTESLTVAHGDQVTVTYLDADCDGAPQVVTAQATVDCVPPQISAIAVIGATESAATVVWVTDELSQGSVNFGDALPPDRTAGENGWGTMHSVQLTALEPCSRYVYSVIATDEAGNQTADDQGGIYYNFVTLEESVLVNATMDFNPGWSLSGAWAWGQPTGAGGEHGNPDPTAGHSGAFITGYNLAGDYTNNMTAQYAIPPAFDCSGGVGTVLSFWRWLGVEQPTYDHAGVEISTDGATWRTVWSNASEIADATWTYCEYDISQWADGQPNVQIRWSMGPTDTGWRYCGWNIDDVVVRYVAECDLPTPTPPPPTFTPTQPPTPTLIATPTQAVPPTDVPTIKPTTPPFPTETPDPDHTPTPEPTQSVPTPAPEDGLSLELLLNQRVFTANEQFQLMCYLANGTSRAEIVRRFIILEVGGSFWFYPRWTQDLDYEIVMMLAGQQHLDTILDFTWPSGAGQASGLRFWGALLDPSTDIVVSDIAQLEWEFR